MNFNLEQIKNLLVSNSKNVVHSVTFLLLSFVLSSILLFLFKADFLALLSIIIYVGSIAVLFLFVVMMLKVKSTTINFNFFFLMTTLILLLLNILLLVDKVFTDNFFLNINTTIVIDVLTNIEVFGQLLYNYNIYLVLLAGFLLLIALVSCPQFIFNYIKKVVKMTFFIRIGIYLFFSIISFESKVTYASTEEVITTLLGFALFFMISSFAVSLINSKKGPDGGDGGSSAPVINLSEERIPINTEPFISLKVTLLTQIEERLAGVVENIHVIAGLLTKKESFFFILYTYKKLTLFLLTLEGLLKNPVFLSETYSGLISRSMIGVSNLMKQFEDIFLEFFHKNIYLSGCKVFSKNTNHDWYISYMDNLYELIMHCVNSTPLSEFKYFLITTLGYSTIPLLLGVVVTTPLVPLLGRIGFLFIKGNPYFLKGLGLG